MRGTEYDLLAEPVGGQALKYADVCRRMQTYADVCRRMLTYADVCWGVGGAEYDLLAEPIGGLVTTPLY